MTVKIRMRRHLWLTIRPVLPSQSSAIPAPSPSSGFLFSLVLRLPIRSRSAPGELGLTEFAQGELRNPWPLCLVY